jgi:hypothetical protein
MSGLVDRIRLRLIPALLTAIGVGLLALGLLSYSTPVAAVPAPSPSPEPTEVAVAATPSPLITLPPLGSGPLPSSSAPTGPIVEPTAVASIPPDRVATRVRVKALKIDLPVMIQPDPRYPACNVAMYLQSMWQPGMDRSIYIYAHARAGMFLPILNASLVSNGKKMLGMLVEVWTSDNQKFLYEITEVRRHQHTLDSAFKATSETLWLQTSEGPKGTLGKTQVLAKPLAQEAADPAEAHPKARPVVCGP